MPGSKASKMLTNHLHILSILRMHGALPPHPHTT